MRNSIVASLSLVALVSVSNDANAMDNRKGKYEFELNLNQQQAGELAVREQSMCDGSADVKIKWDRDKNEVEVGAKLKGLPYRPDLSYPVNPSNEYNQYPDSVSDGNWQLWFLGRIFTVEHTYYYDGVSGDLLFHEYDVLPEDIPENAIPVVLPGAQMVCSPAFEPDPVDLEANVKFTFDYDQILDAVGMGGVIVTTVPVNIFNPSVLTLYYTDGHEGAGAIPPEDAMHMDDILDDVEGYIADQEACAECQEDCEGDEACITACQGTAECLSFKGLGVWTSYEPNPKPDYLLSRDNFMIGWGGTYLDVIPQLTPPEEFAECGTYQVGVQ